MQKDIHPKWYPEAEITLNGEVIMTVGATQPSISVEIWSGTHPFYTGEQRLIDTEGQVDRFMKRLRRREKLESDLEAAKPKEQDPLALTVPEMGVSTRSAKAINEAGHTTVGDVLTLWKEAGDDALLAISGVGQTALISIKRHLRSAGLIE